MATELKGYVIQHKETGKFVYGKGWSAHLLPDKARLFPNLNSARGFITTRYKRGWRSGAIADTRREFEVREVAITVGEIA